MNDCPSIHTPSSAGFLGGTLISSVILIYIGSISVSGDTQSCDIGIWTLSIQSDYASDIFHSEVQNCDGYTTEILQC